MSEENNKDIEQTTDTNETEIKDTPNETKVQDTTVKTEETAKKKKNTVVTILIVMLACAGIYAGVSNSGNSDKNSGSELSEELQGEPVYEPAVNNKGELLTPYQSTDFVILKQGNADDLSEAAKNREDIQVGVYKTMQEINPLLASANYSEDLDIIAAVFEGLGKYDENGIVVPDIAETFVESEDGKTITITLRDDVFFSDGNKVTPSQIVANYRVYMDPSVSCTYSSSLKVLAGSTDYTSGASSNFTSVVANENDEIIFNFENASAENKKVFLLPIQKMNDYNTFTYGKFTDMLYKMNNYKPIGTGPYMVSSVTSSDISISRNNYYENEAEISRITFEAMENSMAVDYLKRGSIDAYKFSYNADMIDSLIDSELVSVYGVLSGTIDFIGFNLFSELAANQNIRKAVAYAINRNDVINETYNGYAQIPKTMTYNSSYAVPVGVETYDFDVEMTKSLLKEEGYTLNSDNMFEKNGELLTLTIYALDTYEEMTNAVVNSLRTSGIDAKFELLSFAKLREEIYSIDKKFDMYISPENLKTEYTLFDRFAEGSRSNIEGYRNAEANEILAAAKSETDDDIRQNLLFKYINILNDEIPVFPICEQYEFIAVSGKIKGLEPSVFTSFMTNANAWENVF